MTEHILLTPSSSPSLRRSLPATLLTPASLTATSSLYCDSLNHTKPLESILIRVPVKLLPRSRRLVEVGDCSGRLRISLSSLSLAISPLECANPLRRSKFPTFSQRHSSLPKGSSQVLSPTQTTASPSARTGSIITSLP